MRERAGRVYDGAVFEVKKGNSDLIRFLCLRRYRFDRGQDDTGHERCEQKHFVPSIQHLNRVT